MPGSHEPEAVYRRWRLAGLVLVLALLTLVVNGSQWLEHRRLRERLADELGDHLVTVAQVAAAAIDGEMLRRWQDWGVNEDEADRLLAYLATVRAQESLSNLLLLDPRDPGGRPLLDVTGGAVAGDTNPALLLDRPTLALVAEGIATATPLYTARNAYLKTGYAPIVADNGEVAGILGVEGSSSLFAVLGEVRRTLIAVSAASILAVVLLGFLLVRISESLATAEKELLRAEVLATMGRMAAGIAHEIRNPLGIIRATAERLARRSGPAGGEDPLLKSIPEEVDRLNAILSGYLSFAADRPSELRPVDLVAVVEQTLDHIRREIEQAGIVVETELALATAPVRGDPGRLRQVLLNLILNARQAMPAGGRLRIELGPDSARPRIRLAVTDTGVGIPRRRLRDVWKPFYTSRADGSGLGLAIVQRIISEQGGQVAIDSEEGRGTRVTVFLPSIAGAGAPSSG